MRRKLTGNASTHTLALSLKVMIASLMQSYFIYYNYYYYDTLVYLGFGFLIISANFNFVLRVFVITLEDEFFPLPSDSKYENN